MLFLAGSSIVLKNIVLLVRFVIVLVFGIHSVCVFVFFLNSSR